MNHATVPSQEYLRNAVLTATPEQLHLMLYDGAIRFAERGREAMRAKDREACLNALERAQLIVVELSNGVRREVNPELVDRMLALYNFTWRRLVDANIHQDEQALDEALRILHHQREAWLLLMEKLKKELGQQQPSKQPEDKGGSEEPRSSFVAEG
jgi:flagellar protein FliS